MLARSGLYVRFEIDPVTGFVQTALVFKGNDLHSGTAANVHEVERDAFLAELDKLFQFVGEENRLVLVGYPGNAGCTRSTPTAVTEPNIFANGSDTAVKTEQRHLFANDGYPVLGTHLDVANRLALEDYYHSYNFRRFSGLLDVSRSLTTVRLPDGTRHTMSPPPFDPEHDAVWVCIMRGYFHQHELNCKAYSLNMTKPQFAIRQAAAKKAWLAATSTSLDSPSTDTSSIVHVRRGAVRQPTSSLHAEHAVDTRTGAPLTPDLVSNTPLANAASTIADSIAPTYSIDHPDSLAISSSDTTSTLPIADNTLSDPILTTSSPVSNPVDDSVSKSVSDNAVYSPQDPSSNDNESNSEPVPGPKGKSSESLPPAANPKGKSSKSDPVKVPKGRKSSSKRKRSSLDVSGDDSDYTPAAVSKPPRTSGRKRNKQSDPVLDEEPDSIIDADSEFEVSFILGDRLLPVCFNLCLLIYLF